MTKKTAQANPVEFAKALADGTRQKIMAFCCCQERGVNEIVEHMGVAQPTVSHHLAILRDAGLVKVRHEGKQTFYTLNQDCIVSCCGQLLEYFAPETDATEAIKKTIVET
jgi:ArsR family transcriptional regulator